MSKTHSYSDAIREGFEYLLANFPETFVMGQGLWSPWYVGDTMKDLDKKFGTNRIIDTPVSEAASTGAAIGASLCGLKPIIVHPRMDFALYAMDSIVNQAAKWSHMMGGQASPSVTIRAIINRGGQQGAQHSQDLHSWFAHVPGLRVVMPSTANDARDLLISSVLCPDPVLFIDDRWLYQEVETYAKPDFFDITNQQPRYLQIGTDLTIVGSGYSAHLGKLLALNLEQNNVSSDLIDIRIINPFDSTIIKDSVLKTRKLVVIDGGTKTSGFAAEVMASVSEGLLNFTTDIKLMRLTLPDAPAPASGYLERHYYHDIDLMQKKILELLF